MLFNSLFAFLHFVAAFGIVAALTVEWLTFGKTPTLAEARRIQTADLWYGVLAGAILAIGFARVFVFEKGSAFYFSNPFFMLKLALFLIAGLISIYPTLKFIRWRKDTMQNRAPAVTDEEYRIITIILRAEMLLLLAIMLSASLMARGVGS